MRAILVQLALLVGLAFPASEASAQGKPADRASQRFITKAIEGNLAEVEMGKLAQEKGSSEGVRAYGQMLQQDHSAAAQKSTVVATQMGITPPREPNKTQKAMHHSLARLSGAAFDTKFAAEMVKDHKKEIGEYEKAAKKQNSPASGYAAETLPTLRKHLETAQSLQRGSR